MTQTQNPNSQDQEAFSTIFKQACIYIGSNVACAKVGARKRYKSLLFVSSGQNSRDLIQKFYSMCRVFWEPIAKWFLAGEVHFGLQKVAPLE
jgi:hypothetical protein